MVTNFYLTVSQYFINLNSITIIYDWPTTSDINRNFLWSLEDIQFNISANMIPLHWIRMPEERNHSELTDLLHQNVELGCQVTIQIVYLKTKTLYKLLQGYIALIENLNDFLSAKYEVQQFSTQRIQDKIFLFLGNWTSLDELFTNPVLQCNIHILMYLSVYTIV